MVRSGLVHAVGAANPHLTPRDVYDVIATILKDISSALASGRYVELLGFGAFQSARAKARRAQPA